METRTEEIVQTLKLYTDGSYDSKRRIGSWAFVLVLEEAIVLERSGAMEAHDSNRMEFQAAINGISSTAEGTSLILISDSRVMLDAMKRDVPIWRENGWRRRSGFPVPNSDLFIRLDELSKVRHITWQWVKAHSGVVLNERCDNLCLAARTTFSLAA
jgi:ribonuclease HI